MTGKNCKLVFIKYIIFNKVHTAEVARRLWSPTWYEYLSGQWVPGSIPGPVDRNLPWQVVIYLINSLRRIDTSVLSLCLCLLFKLFIFLHNTETMYYSIILMLDMNMWCFAAIEYDMQLFNGHYSEHTLSVY